MTHAVKIAVSLPRSQYREVERWRRAHGATRSSAIRSALSHWFHCEEDRQKILCYQEGYRKHPERDDDWKALEKEQAAVLSPEDWS